MLYDRYELLKFERRGKILTVTMDNPPVNAASFQLHDELSHIFYDIARDPDCHVVILTGAGRAFSAGGDFHGMLKSIEDTKVRAESMRRAPHIVHSLLGLDKPVIARVNGHAMGLGATLALLCDVVIAADTAKIADSHVNVGLSAGDGGSLLWPQLIGFARARHHLLTGEPIGAVEAAAIGLIYKAVPADMLDAEVDAYAEKLASGATEAIRATKQSINMVLRRQAEAAIEAHIGLENLTMSSDHHKDAVLALMEKRAPVFKAD
ncbi:enoyl-CoA hydratase/isomerase family protein [Noviherbaspirillum sedimenti]|uniref:Enoyl-CoA hydratase n=1 Tax=Noviherbaspirillum sedimenti TaxID=2320865 RepID=A0A3A3G131_9BURK|nr:enoyl-CoA hydratase-related protein [Noviherbaspirillum sedimenti]RJG01345.1 enoyl-CoA hydratase [Noviherbaspirillum sedimenti]